MKKSELEIMIREVVRKECKTALYEALTELFSQPQSTPKQKVTRPIPQVKPTPKPVQTEQKVFVKDPVLNSILNETANSPESRARIAAMTTGVAQTGEGIDLSTLTNFGGVQVPETEQVSFDQLNEGMDFSVGNLPDMSQFNIAPTQASDVVSDPISRAAEIVKRSLEKSKSKRM
jgi:hypothetical protein